MALAAVSQPLAPGAEAGASPPPVIALLLEPDEHGSIIPDFSRAGYMGGGVALPDVPVVKELSPEPEGCDRERIQAALDAVGEMEPDGDGFRGALLLRAGEYRVHGSIRIEHSGVVLRGEGQFPGGTTIRGTKKDTARRIERHSLVYLGSPGRREWGFQSRPLDFLEQGFRTAIVDDTVPVGSRQVSVESAEGFSVGDEVVIEPRPNEKWLETLGLEEEWAGRLQRGFHNYERRITGIEENRLTLDAPMVHFIDRRMFKRVSVWKIYDSVRISQSGVEHLRLKSAYTEDDPMAEDSANSAVYVNKARDCWVRNVTALHFYFAAVGIRSGARNITVQDCAYLRPVSHVRGGRRYSFYVQGSMNLVQRCYARNARHAFASSPRCAGPNVFLDNLAEKTWSDIGPHQGWDTGYLYDNILAPGPRGEINVQNIGTNHGWRGANTVFWNCKTRSMICDEPPTPDRNWSVGNVAIRQRGRVHEKFGTWISHGERVSPRSLYLWQLEERLGRSAVENITVDVQRQDDTGKIRDYLRKTAQFELNEQERANENNLLLDPKFNTPGSGRWQVRIGGETYLIDDDEVALQRTANPVYGTKTALEVPAAASRLIYRNYWALDYPATSVDEHDYILKFDYKAPVGSSVRARVEHKIHWDLVEMFDGPHLDGKDEWRSYIYEFTLKSRLDEETLMPYPDVIQIRFICDDRFLIANPSLEIRDRRKTPGSRVSGNRAEQRVAHIP